MLSNSDNITAADIDIEEIDNDKALLGFIADYLLKRGFRKTVTTLYDESPKTDLIPISEITNLIGLVSEIRGNEKSGLIEWWRVFWDILKETKRSKRPKISYDIESSPAMSSTAPKRIRKKHPITIPATTQPILDTLDLTSLTGIEKSLTSSGLMNKDLNKLTALEAKRIEVALRSNKVSREVWEIYLRLCKEYQRIPQNIQVPSNNHKMLPYSPYNSISSSISNANNLSSIANVPSIPSSYPSNPSSSSSSSAATSYNNYMGVIDQVNQPVDSKQLLMFRQSLYQEYLKKQQAAISIMTKNTNEQAGLGSLASTGSTGSMGSIGVIGSMGIEYNNPTSNHASNHTSNHTSIHTNNHANNHANNNSNTLTPSNPNLISPPEITNNNFTESSEKEEFFYEFINEYLI